MDDLSMCGTDITDPDQVFSWNHYHWLCCISVSWTTVVSHTQLVLSNHVQLFLLWREHGAVLWSFHVKNGIFILYFYRASLCNICNQL